MKRLTCGSMITRKPMPRDPFPHKIALDENMPRSHKLPLLNEAFDLKHVRDDLGLGGSGDRVIYEAAAKAGRVLITYDRTGYIRLVGTQPDAGVIRVSDITPLPQLDTELTDFFKRRPPTSLREQYVRLDENRKTSD
ncbi:DUF5615 family PIN-like protein [Streptomyces graminilatus]|uniref:DUF5615 family PIN-like protein n=1 Tax=Streptomyces graminilatus TaxID=1464070 RepID=UPI001F527344|nr:DUF5615 family PIN-like protein [Streptomyces graminilatus]